MPRNKAAAEKLEEKNTKVLKNRKRTRLQFDEAKQQVEEPTTKPARKATPMKTRKKVRLDK
jgi:hypothetical protein